MPLILLVIAGVALLAAARAFASQSAASEAPDFSRVRALIPPREPIVGLVNSAVTDVLELFGVVDEKTKRLAEAIAKAEGFGIAGAIPTVNNNPGDLKIPGSKLVNGHTFFATAEDGWNALYKQIGLMRSGRSKVYNPDMTFTQVAQKYAGLWQNWVANVTGELRISPDTTLRQYFEG